MGSSPSGTGCFSAGLPQVSKSCLKTCSSMCSSIHGATGPARNLLHCRLPTGSWPPLGVSPSSGTARGMQGDVCSAVDLHGDSLPHHGLPHRLQGNLLPRAWNTFPSSVFTDLGVCRVYFTYSHSSHSLAVVQQVFFTFLNVLPQRCCHYHCWVWLWQVHLGSSWFWLFWT